MLDRRCFMGTLAAAGSVPLWSLQPAAIPTAELTFSVNGTFRCNRQNRIVVPRLMAVNGREFAITKTAGKAGIRGPAGQMMEAIGNFQGALHKRVQDLLMNRMDDLMSRGQVGFQPGESVDKVRGRYEKQVAKFVTSLGNSYERLKAQAVWMFPREQPSPSGQWAMLEKAAASQGRAAGNTGSKSGASRSSQPGDPVHEGDPELGFDISLKNIPFYATGLDFNTVTTALGVATAAVVIAMALGDPLISSMVLTGVVTAAGAGVTVGTYLAGEAARRWGNQLKPYLPFARR